MRKKIFIIGIISLILMSSMPVIHARTSGESEGTPSSVPAKTRTETRTEQTPIQKEVISNDSAVINEAFKKETTSLEEKRKESYNLFQSAREKVEGEVKQVLNSDDTSTLSENNRDYILKAVNVLRTTNERRLATDLSPDAEQSVSDRVLQIKAFEDRITHAKSDTEIRTHIDSFTKDSNDASMQVKIKVLSHYVDILKRALAIAESRSKRIHTWITDHTYDLPQTDSLLQGTNEAEDMNEKIKEIILTERESDALTKILAEADRKLLAAKNMILSLEKNLINQDVQKEVFLGVRKDLNAIKDLIKTSYPLFREVITKVAAM